MNNFVVGKVIAVKGEKVQILMDSKSNTLTYFYDGETYSGIIIGEYVGIIRGPFKIIGKIENEFLNDTFKDFDDQTYENNRIKRIVEVSIVGYFYQDKFMFGIKYSPMIFNEVVLLNQNEKLKIINQSIILKPDSFTIKIGKTVNEGLDIELPINGLFNSHIGIFGNTGSGKSNTLAKLYHEILNENENFDPFLNSNFVLLDFNGEYIGDKTITNKKKCIALNTRKQTEDKIKMKPKIFWNDEILSILFDATEKTQKPFIKSTLKRFFKNNEIPCNMNNVLKGAIVEAFCDTFTKNSNKESFSELKRIYKILKINTYPNENNSVLFLNALWNSKINTYYFAKNGNDKGRFFNSELLNKEKDIVPFQNYISEIIDKTVLNASDQLFILLECNLIRKLCYEEVNYQYVKYLMNRVESSDSLLNKTIEVTNEIYKERFIVYSFKNCNLEAKKKLPLLISKELYDTCVDEFDDNKPINKTIHLIIDEAHNILSYESNRESESFKDYRLEVFESIIKEGRKFGFYLTIASQRPHDISSTLTSQINNYFIHRLVNDLDLNMISNSISFLDYKSKLMIPYLNSGECILTGNLFKLPMIVQIDKLDKDLSPNSENADLDLLWMNF